MKEHREEQDPWLLDCDEESMDLIHAYIRAFVCTDGLT